MRRPLELTVYERCTCEMDAEPHYAGKEGFKVWFAEDQAYHKRFTGAELAAEYWAASFDQAITAIGDQDVTEDRRRAITLHRFATTPSYDGVAS